MSGRVAGATAVRVLTQLRHDPRTVALLIVVPCVLLWLVDAIIDDAAFQRVGLPLAGIFPLVSMFLVTSIATLRERMAGTLERLMTMPLAKVDLLGGYGLAFAAVATVQALVVMTVAVGALDLEVAGPLWVAGLLAVANAVLGMALGLFLSAFASSEFQAVQFMPAFILPQLVLCGIVAPRSTMARPLELLSGMLPITYAYDGLSRIASDSTVGARVYADFAVIVGFTLAALALGALTLRRRTP